MKVYICPSCNNPMHQTLQPALLPHRPDRVLVECHTDGCEHYMRTLCVGDAAFNDLMEGRDLLNIGTNDLSGE